MKIAYVFPALNTVCGADRVITEKANYFADILGYEVYMITTQQNDIPIFFPLSQKIKHIDLDVNFIRQYHHSFFVRGFIYFKLLKIYKEKLSKLLIELNADFVISTVSREIGFLKSIHDGSIKIAEAHAPKPYLRNLQLLQKQNLLYRIAGRIGTKKMEKAIKNFDAFVVLTQKDADLWSKVRKCTVIPNALPFFPNKTSNCKNKSIISVGRLHEEKGYDRLIEAWAQVAPKHPDWKLNIYGNGKLNYFLTNLIQEKGLTESITIHNPVNNIVDKYIESSFYVKASRFEAFGMVLIEAMACGLPVISFNCPIGPASIISNNDGFLVKDGDINELAEKICYLIDHEDLRIQMGKAARNNVTCYKENIIMQKWVDLFKSLKDKQLNKTK